MYKLQNNHQIIPLMNKLLIVFLFCIFSTNLFSKESNNYFKKGKDHYNKKNIEEAKLNFEKDIVRNTKNLESYLMEKIMTIGTSACPPYHLAVVIAF